MIKFAVIRLRLTVDVEVGGANVRFEAAQFASTFAENSIPSASALLAVGLDVRTGEVAKIHTHINEMREQLPVVVTLIPTVEYSENATSGVEFNPPQPAFVIFRGKTAGGGWQRTSSGAYFVLHMIHWLADLHYGSAISGSVHPGSIGNFVWPSIIEEIRLDGEGAGSGAAGWFSQLRLPDGDIFAEDLWGKVLYAWLDEMSKQDAFDRILNLLPVAGGVASNTSTDLRKALNRIVPNPAGKKLTLDVTAAGADNDVLRNAIRRSLEAESPSTWTQTTMWGKIVGEWASQYMFTVVPRVEDALIVPFTGPIRLGEQPKPESTPASLRVQTVIGINDYVGGNTYAPMPQRLRGVGIIHESALISGLPMAAGGIAAMYPELPEPKGAVLLKEAPAWLAGYVPGLLNDDAARTQGEPATGGNATVPISTSLDEEGTGQPAKNPISPEVAARQPLDILCKFAKQWYALESLKGRTAEIAGKLRFDIAPGSQVLVQGASSRNLNSDNDQLAIPFVATASQITYAINAEQQQAGTVITLSHMRTVNEDREELFSMEKSPLYAELWIGAALIDGAIPEGF